MRILKPRWTIEHGIDDHVLEKIEKIGRTCYKSEDRITQDSAAKFVKMLSDRGHFSVLEHHNITVRFQCDRGVSHELVRHRIGSYSQESTRYCNYSKKKFGKEVSFIDIRPFVHDVAYEEWLEACGESEKRYFGMLDARASPQFARGALPNSVKTEIVTTYNISQWRYVFTKRTTDAAHPQMCEVMRPLLVAFRRLMPVLFDDIGVVDPVYKVCPECQCKHFTPATCRTCDWVWGKQPLSDWIALENARSDQKRLALKSS